MIKKFNQKLTTFINLTKHKVYSFKNRDSIKDKIIVILAVPRSGSTWLFDILRCHPVISMHPRYELYDRLGSDGNRRYPRDLSGNPDATRNVEVLRGHWEQIPEHGALLDRKAVESKANVEKTHPHFFHHDVASFVDNVAALAKEREIKLIYQVRDPKATLVSFLEYKRRKPSWDHRNLEGIPSHLRRVYESISSISEHFTGLVADYDLLQSDPRYEMKRVLDFALDEVISEGDVRHIHNAVSREERKSTGTSFIGKKRSEELTGNYEAYFLKHKGEIDRCYIAYNALLGGR